MRDEGMLDSALARPQRIRYLYTSHFLVPACLRSAHLFRIERKHPEECRESDRKSLEDVLEFVEKLWQQLYFRHHAAEEPGHASWHILGLLVTTAQSCQGSAGHIKINLCPTLTPEARMLYNIS